MGARRDIGKAMDVVGGLLALYALIGLIVRLIWDRNLGFVSRLLRDGPWWTLLLAGVAGLAIAMWGDHLKRGTSDPSPERLPAERASDATEAPEATGTDPRA